MEQRISIASEYIKRGEPTSRVLKCCSISSSTWYDRLKSTEERKRFSPGRPIPGYTINPDGSYVTDATIVSALKKYRKQTESKNAGGYQKLKHYLRRDYQFHINGKKLYRLCKKHNLLLPHNKKKIRTDRKVCTYIQA